MTFWHRKQVRARKEHTCSLCRRTIYIGEDYLDGRSIEPGSIYAWKECLHCEALFSFLSLLEDDEGYTPDTANEWEPENVAELRVQAQWRLRWQRIDGGLQPVPEVIREERPNRYSPVVYSVVVGVRSGAEHWPVGVAPRRAA